MRAQLFAMDETHPGAAKLSRAGEWYVRAIANNDQSKGRHFGFSGSVGTGKTMVAKGIYRFVRNNGPDLMYVHSGKPMGALWIEWPNVAELDDEDDFAEIRRQLNECRFVVLDDIGSESDRFKNGVSASRLRRVLAMTENHWTVITSNLNLAQIFEAYDARSVDRLRSYTWLDGGDQPSYRPKLKNNLK